MVWSLVHYLERYIGCVNDSKYNLHDLQTYQDSLDTSESGEVRLWMSLWSFSYVCLLLDHAKESN